MATRDQLRIEEAIDQALSSSLGDLDKALVEAWADVWGYVSREIESALVSLAMDYPDGRIPPAALRRDPRLQSALVATYAALDDLAERSPALAASTLATTVQASSAGQAEMIAAGLTGQARAELRSSVTAADPLQLAVILERTTQQITSRNYHLANEAQAAIRVQISRGIAVGANPRRAASLALRGIEDQWNGGLERARVIARTEMIDAHREAARRTEIANSDVVAGWEWLTHVDERTCRACLSQHGSRHEVEEPGPLGHPQCRCARVVVTKSWEELGFGGMRDQKSRTGTAKQLVDSMSADELRTVLGQDGYDAFKRGEYPIEDWSKKRSASGWRDSYVATRPPKV